MEHSIESMGEECYSSCGLFKYKASVASQFAFTSKLYKPEVFIRYFLIILVFGIPTLYANHFHRINNPVNERYLADKEASIHTLNDTNHMIFLK